MSDLDPEVQKDLEKDQVEDPSESEDEETPTGIRYAITSYGADYPVDSLVKRLREKDIIIPKFQRGYVWSSAQASRFIESLLLGLPVPGIFLSRDFDSQKLLVIDGQQRLMTVLFFYNGLLRGKEFTLRGVRDDLEGLSYESLSEEDRRKLDDQIMHATIVRQEDPKDDFSSIFMIFERLNTGGTPLSSQEIRTSIFHGPFSDLLREFNTFEPWRTLFGPTSVRLKDEELILRFFALLLDLETYKRPMKVFLSKFMESNRLLDLYDRASLEKTFAPTVAYAMETIGPKAFRPERNLNTSVTDALLVATAMKLRDDGYPDSEAYSAACLNLLAKNEFLDKCRTGTTDEDNVKGRILLAREALRSA